MGLLSKLAEYSSYVVADYDSAMQDLRKAVDDKDFRTDHVVQNGLKLWLNSVDRWCNLFAPLDADPTPIAFFDVVVGNHNATTTIHTPFVKESALEKTDIVPLGGASGKIAAMDVALSVKSTGILQVSLSNLDKSGLSAGLYQGFVLHRANKSADPTPFASIAVRVG